MPITFFNVNTGEERTVDTEPLLAAFYNSSDQHENARRGQDYGWRLAPNTVKRIRQIRSSQPKLDQIAQAFYLPQGEVADTDIVRWISLEDARAKDKKIEQQQGAFSRQYEDDIRALDEKQDKKPVNKSNTHKVNRSATDGGFVSEEEAKANPDTTITETVKNNSANESDSAKIEKLNKAKEN